MASLPLTVCKGFLQPTMFVIERIPFVLGGHFLLDAGRTLCEDVSRPKPPLRVSLPGVSKSKVSVLDAPVWADGVAE